MLICCEVEVKFSSGVCHDHMRTIQAFTLYQFHVRVLVCDGASSNLAFMKLLCGCEHEQLPLADADDQLAVSASLKIIHGFKLTSHQVSFIHLHNLYTSHFTDVVILYMN